MDNSSDLFNIISVVSGLGFLYLGFLQWKNSSKVGQADVAEKIGNAYGGLVKAQNDKIKELEQRMVVVEKELKLYIRWSNRLIAQLAALGVAPVTKEILDKEN